MTRPVSLIVSSYDQLDFLRLAVDSALSQTVPFHEVIVVDDASPDGGASCDYLVARVSSTPNLRFVRHDLNLGLSEVRNTGIDLATGDYIGFLDGDDWLEPHAHERMQALVAERPDILLFGLQAVEDGSGKPSDLFDDHPFITEAGLRHACPRTEQEIAELFFLVPPVWRRLFRRDFIRDKKLRFKGRVYEDVAWVFMALLQAETIRCSREALVNYRIHADSMLRRPSLSQFELFEVYGAVDSFLGNGPGVSPVIRDAFRQHRLALILNCLFYSKRIPEETEEAFARRAMDIPDLLSFTIPAGFEHYIQKLRALAKA